MHTTRIFLSNQMPDGNTIQSVSLGIKLDTRELNPAMWLDSGLMNN